MPSAISISAKDLVSWADNYTARFTLPQLIRRLILASGKNITKLHLPSDEQVSRPGYDGVVKVRQGNAWIPDGLSVWEMGVDKNPSAKAEEDYLKRNKKPGVRRSTATFVFVTPRTWLGREKWCRKKERGKKWTAVKVLDCADLAEWLDSVPPVTFWAARLLGKRPRGVCDITAHWQNIRDLSTPKLVPDTFLAGRDSETKAVSEWLTRAPEALFIEADSADEVVDYFCAFAMSKPADSRVEEARGMIAETREAFRDLSASTTPLILVARLEIEAELVREAVRQGHHVLVTVPQGPQPTPGAQRLRRLPAHEVEKALVTGNFDFQRAKKIGRESGGSSIVLKRLVVSGPPQLPKWASPSLAPKLAPFLLVGGWDDSNANDRRIVSEITGANETEVRAIVHEWSRSADPMFRRKENTYRLVSRVDSWRWLASYLDQRATDEYAKHFPELLALDDPRFELKPEDRIMASVLGKKLRNSGILRKGIAEAYALLCVSFDSRTEMPTAQIGIQLWELFESLFPQDMTWRRWASLGGVLELFAEARPDAFLDVIERELGKNSPSLTGLFGQEHFFSGSPITGLMWALETLGWEPNYLLRVGLCLASLSELDPGGNWNPRPFGVLTSLFHPLFPQTTASTERRFEVLDEIAKTSPNTGWRLFLHLLPKGGGISLYNHQPRWRNWCEGWHRGVRKRTEAAKEFDSLADRIVSTATAWPQRLVELLSHISHFKAAARDRLFDALRNVNVTTLDDPTRESLARSLADFINDTRRVQNAWWALPKATIDGLETILNRIQPDDLCLRHRWLFQQWPQMPGLSYETPLEARESAVAHARTSALTEVVRSGGLPLLRRMAEESTASWTVGKTAASAKLITDNAILPTWLCDSNSKNVEAARAFGRTRFDAEGWSWVQSLHISKWTVAQIVNFGLALPFEPQVWDFLKTHSEAAADEYWKVSSGYNRALGLSDYERAVREWLARKRPGPAVDLLSLILDEHKPDLVLVLESLEVLLLNASSTDVQTEVAWGGFRIGQLIKYLQNNPLNDNSRLLALEWNLLPFLLQARESPETLFAALASQPSLFVELLGTMCRRTDEREKPAKELSQQEKNRAELARELLDAWRVLPGTQPDGSVAEPVLRDWAEAVREEAKAQKLEDVADYRVGALFAHAPTEADGVWPCVPVRKIVEDWKSEELESGMSCERFNRYQPGSVTRPIAEKTWDELVRKHRKDAAALAGRWPRTAAFLREMAASYEGTARRHERDRLHDD